MNLEEERIQDKYSFCNAINRYGESIDSFMKADKLLFNYYKNLPNADEWQSYIRSRIDVSLKNLRESVEEAKYVIELIDDDSEYSTQQNEYWAGSCLKHTHVISLSELIINETLIKDSTRMILSAVAAGDYELFRLLITRKEAALFDDLFAIIEYIRHVKTDHFNKLAHLKLIEETVAAQIA